MKKNSKRKNYNKNSRKKGRSLNPQFLHKNTCIFSSISQKDYLSSNFCHKNEKTFFLNENLLLFFHCFKFSQFLSWQWFQFIVSFSFSLSKNCVFFFVLGFFLLKSKNKKKKPFNFHFNILHSHIFLSFLFIDTGTI